MTSIVLWPSEAVNVSVETVCWEPEDPGGLVDGGELSVEVEPGNAGRDVVVGAAVGEELDAGPGMPEKVNPSVVMAKGPV